MATPKDCAVLFLFLLLPAENENSVVETYQSVNDGDGPAQTIRVGKAPIALFWTICDEICTTRSFG